MADPITFESIGVAMSTQTKERRARPQTDTPFKILIMGDFSGRANRWAETDGPDIVDRQLIRVDRDNDEQVMAKMDVSVRLDALGAKTPPVELTFAEMDDFHPEQIYLRAPLFAAMKQLRKRLADPDTFVEAAEQLSATASQATGQHNRGDYVAVPPRAVDFSKETRADFLDQVLDATAPPTDNADGLRPATNWDRFIDAIVGPHLVPDIQKEQDAMLAVIDRTIAASMRRILHHPDFQAIESAWRGLRFCLRGLETDEQLVVYLLDVSKSELISDLTAHDDLQDTELYRKLSTTAEPHNGQTPWSLVASMIMFASKKEDAILAARLGALGQMLEAPVIGGAEPNLAGCASLFSLPDPSDWMNVPDSKDRQAWKVVRTLPEARWIGLALPRIMMRLPYGRDTDPVDGFELEEMSAPSDHESYLWANPIFGLVMLLGRTFTANGWDWSRGLRVDVSGLPLHMIEENGERRIKPCGEVRLHERAVTRLVEEGLMPLVSLKDQDCVRLVRLQSIADPPSPLQGRWSR